MDKFFMDEEKLSLEKCKGFWVGSVYADLNTKTLSKNELKQPLSELSFSLLLTLIEHQNNPLPAEQLQNIVWQGVITGNENVKQRISILRKAFQALDEQEQIKNIRGKGYLLAQPVKLDYVDHTFKGWPYVMAGSVAIIVILVWLSWIYTSTSKVLKSEQYQLSVLKGEIIKLANKKPDVAFCLDGFDDYVEVVDSELDVSTGDFSISTWIQTSSTGQHIIVDKRYEDQVSDVQGYVFYIDDGYLALQLADGDGSWYCQEQDSSCTFYDSQAFVADGQWHHVAVSIDRDRSKGIRFYLDGQFNSAFDPTGRQGSLSNEKPLRIGSRSSFKTGLFKGAIGEIQIHHNVMTPSQIREQYKQGNYRSCSGSGSKGGI
ncbi:LamG-like jellyroll fold domain-containing protein [Pseudoalteromonas luteoviolacea]|uniref:LamG-like jellyroll fold domain-containing protein n=1 Tax=Pseudoalteromonas luteoviolacea TaxID=43657 RepID=UPI001B38F957|nr:LamG-like jellyroll fold domain-containing protein [Pseudoalteromonas luteoviolacea]MBQ4837601.1 winged helix-turn-helix domain-containing protein [Pseudoalteromonas luteoviolacea]